MSLSIGLLAGVYPRVCGGTGLLGIALRGLGGLSPRVRGNRRRRRRLGKIPGSIPACAGEPICRVTPVCSLTVYPRVCGGTHPRQPEPGYKRGLSPRVRGNP